MLLSALIFYLKYEAPEEEQNFPMVNEMLRAGKPKEDDDNYESPLDILFKRLEFRNPNHIAVKYYKDYHSGSGRTLKSIQVTLASRLEKFNIDDIASLSMVDELELGKLGEKKVALFAIIPDNHTAYNFLVSILYTQLFQELLYKADNKYKGALPMHVHFVMDEFANVSLPDDFDKVLSVMRSRNISVSIILQNLSQLKALFEKQWESIVGNCDEFLYLRTEMSKVPISMYQNFYGKETIDINTYGKSQGQSSSYSTNYQNTGRELMIPDEVRMLDNSKAILIIRGEKPIIDNKYDILKHPNVKYTADGNGKIYEHGEIGRAKATLLKLEENTNEIEDTKEINNLAYELLSDDDIEEYFEMEEKENEENNDKEERKNE